MDRRRRGVHGVAALALLAALAAPAHVYAQAEITGTVSVSSRDAQGGVLPGVGLTLKGPANTFTGTTDGTGMHRFVLVPAGVYSLDAMLDGFQALTVEKIDVNFGETRVIEITLQVAGVSENVTVISAPPQIDTTLTTTKELVEPALIEAMPLRDRNFQDILKLLPGVVDNRVRGSRSTSTGWRIDGVNNVDPYSSEIAINFSQQAIDRFELVPGGFQAKYGEYSGGIANVTTKSGANTTAGHAGFFFRNDGFVARPSITFPGQLKATAPDTRRFYEGAFGGPITRDRLLYFLAAEYRTAEVGSVFAERTQTAKTTLGSGKVNYNQTDRNLWSFFAATNIVSTKNIELNRFSSPEFNANTDDKRHLLSLNLNHIFGPTLFLESQFSMLRLSNVQERTDPNAHTTLYVYTPQGTFNTGRYSTESDYWRARYRLSEALTWHRGAHDVSTGLEIGRVSTGGERHVGPTIFDLRGLGVPLAYHYYFPTQVYDVGGTEVAAHVQDSWVVTSRATVDAGLRLEYQSITKKTNAAPRVGVSVDVTGDRKTKVYGNAGLFFDRVFGLYMQWATRTGGDQFNVANPTGPMADGEEVFASAFRYRLGGQKTPYAIGWSLGLERLMPYDLKVGVNYNQKSLKNQLLSYRVTDPQYLWFEFRPDGTGSFKGAEFSLSKRFSHNFQSLFSYTVSRATGNGAAIGTFYTLVQVPDKQTVEDFDRTHVVKASGLVKLPFDVDLSANYIYATGLPYSVISGAQAGLYYVGDRNGQRMPSTQSLDLTLGKNVALGRTRFGIVVEGYNITNHDNVTGVSTAPANKGEPTRLDLSRTFQVGFTVDF